MPSLIEPHDFNRPIDPGGDENGNGILDACEPPVCEGLAATVYVDVLGTIVGGPLDGRPYFGILIGTPGDDVIVGTDGDDLIIGFSGDDLICGGTGDDRIVSGGRRLRPRLNSLRRR